MNNPDDAKNIATDELINFQKYIGKLRESFKKLPIGQIENGAIWKNEDARSDLAIELFDFGLWDWDLRANQVYFSPQWKEMLGYHNSENGDNIEAWFERIHPNDLKSALTSLSDHLKGETVSVSFEHRILGKDQVFKWILSEGKVTDRDDNGNPIRLIGINKDITQRKNTEFALRKRVKELNCHNRISEIMSNSNFGADEVLDMVVHTIPDSWQFSNIAQAAITINNKIYKTAGFQPSNITLIQEIKVNEKFIGKVEVGYPESSQFPATPVFLVEESELLFSIAVRVGNFIEKSEKNFALQKSEERYRNIIENINDVIFEIDAHGIVTFISSPVIKIFGYSAEEIRSKNFIQFVGDHGQFLLNRLNELGEKLELKNEYQIYTKTGESRWIQMSTRAIISGGNFIGGTGTIIDITQRKQTEIELQKSESMYRSVLNASPDTITITNLDGIIIYSSPRILEMFGYEHSNDVINRSLFDFIYKPDHPKVHSNLEKLFLGSLLRAEEYTGIRSDGTLFCIEVNAEFIRDPEGNPASMLFITRDISERKQTEEMLQKSEEKYRNLVERLNDVIYEITDESIVTYVSPAIERIVGYTPLELIGRSIFEFMHHDDIHRIKRALSNLGKRDIPYQEYRYLTKNGSIVWVRTSTTPIYEDGRMIGGTGSLTDITERKLAEEKILKLNRLYSVISHVSQIIIHVRDKSELMNEVCRIAIEFGEFRMAWIGLIDEKTKTVKPVAIQGFEEGYLSIIRQISMSDVPEGRGPTGKAIRFGDHFVCNDIETDSLIAPWRSEALKRGYRSSIALPLKQSGKIIGSFSLYSSKPNFFDQEEVRLLDEFVNEISFAFETIELEIERRKAEEQLRKLSLAVEQSPVSIVIADLEGNIEYANPKASSTTGYSFNELIGKNPRVLKSGETPDGEYQKLWEDITSGQVWHGIFHNKRKNGELYWESSTISPIVDYKGKITQFLAVKEDITKQKLAEQEILKFRTIADQANYGTAITSLDGNLLYINDTFARMHGYEPNDLLGKSLTIFHNQEQLPIVMGLIEQLRRTGNFSAKEVWHTHKDGTVFPTIMNASIIYDAQNVPQFLSATAIDVSELKQKELELKRSENELNNAQELARMGSWEHNLITGQLVGSKNYYRMMGLEPKALGINLYDHFLSIVITDDLPIINFLQNHQYTENEMQVVDIRIQLPGKGIRWLQNNVQPVFKDGCLVKLRGVNIDITEKKKIMEDLIKAKEQAEESDKLKTSFLNNISHEIRTPFNGILGFLSMLQYDDLSSNERDQYITFINQSANRLMNTINDVVDISQIQIGLMKPTFSFINIQNIINEQVFHFKPEAEIKGLDFNVNNELTDSPENFSTDSNKLKSILSHLIGNAIKFTNSGYVKLIIRGNDRMLEFCVEDTGIGISQDKQEIIFNRFIQADHSNTRNFEGSGLGLTIAKDFVEMLNGKLWLKSVEGQGSAFSFTIPNSAEPLEKISFATDVRIDFEHKDLKILIAEDDEASSFILSTLMKPFGNEIITVRSGQEAVEICHEHPDIDLILMDIRMPGLDGYDATRQIRKFNQEVIIIAQTAYALTGDYQKAIDAGCNEYISKPIQTDKLQLLIRKFFH